MGNSSYFRFDYDNNTKYIYSLNHHKEMGKLKTHGPTYCIIDNWEKMRYLAHLMKYIWQAFLSSMSSDKFAQW